MKKIQPSICKRLCSYCFLTMLVWSASVQAEYKVLFIGNSYTIGSANEKSVPNIFDALARAGGHEDPTTVMRAVGGQSFEYHYNNSVDDYINAQAWTHVILQNYSTGPTHVGNIANHMLYGELLYDAVMANNPETQVHLYMTWARAEANELITGTSTSTTFESTDEMLDELRTNYYDLANSLTADHPENLPVVVNPIGDAWNNAGGNLPASDPDFVDLFYSDEYHGNNLGYYLSACVHYASIYKSSPVGLFETDIMQDLLAYYITNEEAAFLEQIAWETVLATDIIEPSISIDFGATASQAEDVPEQGQYWNNLTESTAGTLNGSISGLLDKTGGATTVDLSILSPFNSVESTGTEASTIYSAAVTMDALYGNTESYNEQSNVTPSFKLSGLESDVAYRLSFYGSRSGGSDNYQTRYTVSGDRVVWVDLDPQDNINTIAESEALYPDANNEITVSLSAGPENNNEYHLIYLGALKLYELSEADLSIASQPASQTIEENASISFSVTVESERLVTAQWYQDGVPISGASSLTYTIDQASYLMDGSEFSVIIDNGVFSVESSVAVLTVIADLTAPELDELIRTDTQTLQLTFNEAIAAEAALLIENYSVANRGQLLSPSAVELSDDGLTITLTFDSILYGNAVVQFTEQITDLAGNAMASTDRIQNYISSGSIYIDFGDNSTVSGSADTWNVVPMNSTISNAISSTGEAYVYFNDLLEANGAPSGIGLSMSDALSGSSVVGTSAGTYPIGATNDSVWGSDSDPQGVFHFYNLNPETSYDFTFYASRTSVSENREANYALQGANSGSVDLNPTQNINNTATISGIRPTTEGVITLTVSAGDDNDQDNHYYYLSLIEMTLGASAEAQVFMPVSLGDSMIIDWTGTGTLMWTDDLSEDWQAVDSEITAPFQDTPASAGARFYRLEY
jgi:hypothetical protein